MKKLILTTLLGLGVASPVFGEHKHDKAFYQRFQDRQSLEQELTTCQKTADGYVRMSDLYIINKEISKGIDACEKALECDPNSWEAMFNLSTAYTSMKQFNKAKSYCEKAWKLCDSSYGLAAICSNLACIESQFGNNEGVKFYVREGLKHNPQHISLLKIQAIYGN